MTTTAVSKRRIDMPAVLAWFVVAMVVVGLFSRIFQPDLGVMDIPRLAICLAILAIAGVRYELGFMRNWVGDLILGLVTAISAWLLVTTVSNHQGDAALGFWALTAATWAASWLFVERLAIWKTRSPLSTRIINLAIPALFGISILVLWEIIVTGAGVPKVLLPAPSEIGVRLATSVPILWADFQQTFMKAVLAGYAIGCGSAFVAAILVDRVPFLRRGLLPVGNLVSALPIIGVAPIMVMWFGFDWPSKAAVVVIMTFFPMLVNTVAGLAASDAMQRDLMRTYASNYWQTLFKLRLPMAMPFIFNALKINSTLALIGAIVAEFFGTPIVGMGFRISTEVGRMNVDMVWAEIAIAALAGSLFYGIIALIERAVTFWHPSVRG
ncbi:ABC transporter permease subunit [Roseibium album]|uniref:ABC transporter permease subunit n=1 Tax=Roseibium album TaxID=311410 RepID=UPI000CF16070|nr:NitT/TauT family transport system permease protein [Labrenzia sp. EL_142]MBG6156280.1 NitT/TauT family transport system permease protein [Labrenzia sp. EL_162]MBG6164063.1 NitT/TauT family transport system permease protein [Labrenzia sp. EL_195]MBG6194811.1 NitT/TauT family transport system permease protein [Labrenzia sp. EL_159]